ncbi:MAG: DegT/DnrJ/EryC1/StrS family aminotransferase [Syntrophomonas sp.]
MSGFEKAYIEEAFTSNWVAPLGPNVDAFENEIAAYLDVKSAAALSSGTAAIHLALKALNIGQGDIVFCSDLTFVASCNPIIYQNATPVFIDSEPEGWNMSTAALKKAFQQYTPKAVIVVNLYGQSADLDGIKTICDRYQVPIIEDAAESLGATYRGRASGTFGKFGAFSFNGNKIITTSGGGMLVSDDEKAISKVRFWATQARDPARYYQHSELGYNYRMSNICAGIGRGQLKVLNERVRQKKAIYEIYKDAFFDIPAISMANICDFGEPNFWLSVITLDVDSSVKPLDIMVALEAKNVESRPVWKPMHLQPFYEKCAFFSHFDSDQSISEGIFTQGICLPSDTKMTKEQQSGVIEIVKGCFL